MSLISLPHLSRSNVPEFSLPNPWGRVTRTIKHLTPTFLSPYTATQLGQVHAGEFHDNVIIYWRLSEFLWDIWVQGCLCTTALFFVVDAPRWICWPIAVFCRSSLFWTQGILRLIHSMTLDLSLHSSVSVTLSVSQKKLAEDQIVLISSTQHNTRSILWPAFRSFIQLKLRDMSM